MDKMVNGFLVGLLVGLIISVIIITIIVALAIHYSEGLNKYPTKEEWKAGLRRK